MVKKIDSQALGVLNKSLGLSGAGSPSTELTDGIVDQVLSVGEVVRRSRTQAGSEGLYSAILQNVHTDAEVLTVQINPYNIGTGVIPPWPDPMPAGFDIWLMGASVRRVSGASTLTGALFYQWPSANQGWGVDDSGVAVVESAPMGLIHWDSLVTLNTTSGRLQGSRGLWQSVGMRLPRGSNGSLRFVSSSSVTATFDCQIILGVFPAALGQDGVAGVGT